MEEKKELWNLGDGLENVCNSVMRKLHTYDFIRLLDENWQRWISTIVEKPTVLKTVVVLPKDGCIKAWAEDMRGGLDD